MKEVWRRHILGLCIFKGCIVFYCLESVLRFYTVCAKNSNIHTAIGGFTDLFHIRTVYAKQFRVVSNNSELCRVCLGFNAFHLLFSLMKKVKKKIKTAEKKLKIGMAV